MGAVSAGYLSSRQRLAAQRVFSRRDWLEMPRVRTKPVAAKVVEEQSVRYWANQGLVCEPVAPYRSTRAVTSAADSNAPVATPPARCPSPNPAVIIDQNLLPEA